MLIEKIEFKHPSSDGIHTLSGVVYLPEGERRGYFHIVHGMTEHIGRYDRIMTAIAERGYVCFGYDNLGHKGSVNDKSELGYIAKKKGYDFLAKDVKGFSDAVRAKYGDMPYYLMGHSMGSFIVRLAAEKYVTPDKLIIMGTGGSNPAAGAGIALISLIKLFKGDKYISPFVYKLAFGGYNSKFVNDADYSSQSWLSTNLEVRNKYLEDDYCTFKFTVSAMGDLMSLLKLSNRTAWYKNIAGKMPILLVSGAVDPVGNYGKGIKEVEAKLKKRGADVKCVLYEGARHEILNDFTYDAVKDDILSFIG
jgi:alpha-beta hydrolase superfamily lysophospholipase